jgi:hypothetical protein
MTKSLNSFKCKICNKYYHSYQSLWNHNKKFHNNICDHYINLGDHKDTNICKYCNKLFANRHSRWRHEKNCKPKINLIEENNLLKEKLNKIKTKTKNININSNNNINSHNTNTNNINNNFNLNVQFDMNQIGHENINDLTTEEKKEILYKDGESITKYVELTNFNKALPMNHSFCVSDLKSKYVNVFNNKEKRIDKYRKKYFFDKLNQIAAKNIQNIYNENLKDPLIGNNDDIKRTIQSNIDLSNNFFNDKLFKELSNGIETIAYNNKNIIKDTWSGKNNNIEITQLKIEIRKLLDKIKHLIIFDDIKSLKRNDKLIEKNILNLMLR